MKLRYKFTVVEDRKQCKLDSDFMEMDRSDLSTYISGFYEINDNMTVRRLNFSGCLVPP